MDFELGDFIVYTPNVANLPPPSVRSSDWAHVVGWILDFIIIKFIQSENVRRFPRSSITHHPNTQKYIKTLFNPCLSSIQAAVEAREARQLILHKTNISVRIPGPAHLIQEFITNVKRSKTNMKALRI
jgi:hypothetical protein